MIKKVFTIYFPHHSSQEPKRFEVIEGETLLQRQVIGAEGSEPVLEVAIVNAETKQIEYAYGVPVSEIYNYEFTTERSEIVDHKPEKEDAGEGLPDAQEA